MVDESPSEVKFPSKSSRLRFKPFLVCLAEVRAVDRRFFILAHRRWWFVRALNSAKVRPQTHFSMT